VLVLRGASELFGERKLRARHATASNIEGVAVLPVHISMQTRRNVALVSYICVHLLALVRC
jgi:hypothetical protein